MQDAQLAMVLIAWLKGQAWVGLSIVVQTQGLCGAFEVPNLDEWKSDEAYRLLDEYTCVVERKNEVPEKRYRTQLRWLMCWNICFALYQFMQDAL